MMPTEARHPPPTDVSLAAIATAALAAFFAPYMETAPLPEARSQPAAPAASADIRGADMHLSSWLEQQEAGRHPMSVSSGDMSVVEPAPFSSVTYSAPHVSTRPILQARDLVHVARSAFRLDEVQLLVPSILRNFDTQLTSAELAERLQLLWLMRCEIATQVHDIILLDRVRRQRPDAVQRGLLELAELLASDSQQ